jgi:hypothetical protein
MMQDTLQEGGALLPRRDWLKLAALGLVLPAAGAEALRQLRPDDTATPDPALDALLARMRRAVKAKDTLTLERMMLPDFRVEFDAGKGPLAFHRHWHSERPGSPLWDLLPRLLTLKGSFYSPTLFALPYIYAHFPSDLDPLAHVVAESAGVALREKPSAAAAQVGTLDYSIVPLVTPLRPPVFIVHDQFLEVNHPAAGRCFVSGAGVYSPAGHRMFFEKRKGQWRWISLAAATLAEPPDLKRSGKAKDHP